MSKRLLKVGDIIELNATHTVYARVAEKYVYSNRRNSRALTKTEVEVGSKLGLRARLPGRYVVIQTRFDGGGTGMGPHDVYPDGHHVICQKLDDTKRQVDFYQTGCFTAMIKDIDPVGKAKVTLKVEIEE